MVDFTNSVWELFLSINTLMGPSFLFNSYQSITQKPQFVIILFHFQSVFNSTCIRESQQNFWAGKDFACPCKGWTWGKRRRDLETGWEVLGSETGCEAGMDGTAGCGAVKIQWRSSGRNLRALWPDADRTKTGPSESLTLWFWTELTKRGEMHRKFGCLEPILCREEGTWPSCSWMNECFALVYLWVELGSSSELPLLDFLLFFSLLNPAE